MEGIPSKILCLCCGRSWVLDSTIEKKLKERVIPILEKGRPGDVEHTMRVLDIGRYLLKHEKGDEDVVVPAIYLHDLGYSKVNCMDFQNMMPENHERPPWNEKNPLEGPPPFMTAKCFRQHMEHGAVLAKEILMDLDYPENLVERIVVIVAVHDYGDKVFAMNDDSALVVFEADHLDRLHPDGNKRIEYFRKLGPLPEYVQNRDRRSMREHMMRNWFKTATAKKRAKEWFEALEN